MKIENMLQHLDVSPSYLNLLVFTLQLVCHIKTKKKMYKIFGLHLFGLQK